jgi:hypothetical protein
MSKWVARLVGLSLFAVCATGCVATVAYADTLESPNYKFDETSLGGGGLIQSNSANYQAGVSIGDTAIGNSASTNFQTEAGSKTTNDPTLSFTVNTATANFGSFSPSTPAVTTSTFSVSNYTSYGYVVQILGNPPSNQGHTLDAMATTGTSQTGIEQFGINLVANTAPSSVGANPDHGQFGFGDAAPNYATPNNFRYVSGETIAIGPKSSGLTTYTISYVINVDSLTPGGQYAGNQVLICTGTY